MFIKQLHIEGFRNLKTQTLKLDPKINVFVGRNGSGKTSLLESVCFLSLGRSFRLSGLDGLINFNQSFAAVSAVYCGERSQQIKINTVKHKNQDKINKIGGERASLSQIARLAPTQIIHEGSSKLIFAEPENRRKFLDWIIFYTHSKYHELWQQFNRILQQRNSLLKQRRADFDVIQEIDKIYVGLAEQMKQLRENVWQDFYEVWKECFSALGFNMAIQPEIQLNHGWEGDLLKKLVQGRTLDSQQGFTAVGPHRADLKFSINNKNAKEVLSRGQGKVVTLSLILARALFLHQLTDDSNMASVLLIDDLCSELDNVNAKKISQFLINPRYNLQVLVTGIKQKELLNVLPKNLQYWFNLKEGLMITDAASTEVIEI